MQARRHPTAWRRRRCPAAWPKGRSLAPAAGPSLRPSFPQRRRAQCDVAHDRHSCGSRSLFQLPCPPRPSHPGSHFHCVHVRLLSCHVPLIAAPSASEFRSPAQTQGDEHWGRSAGSPHGARATLRGPTGAGWSPVLLGKCFLAGWGPTSVLLCSPPSHSVPRAAFRPSTYHSRPGGCAAGLTVCEQLPGVSTCPLQAEPVFLSTRMAWSPAWLAWLPLPGARQQTWRVAAALPWGQGQSQPLSC